MAKGFEDLQVWQMAHALRLLIHRRVAAQLPAFEAWDLARQLRRSSKSIGANIAEGYGRFYYLDNIRFCYNARGSLLETVDHLITARDLGYIEAALYSEARNMADQTHRLLNGYIAFLKQRRFGADEPGLNISVGNERNGQADTPASPDKPTD